MLIRPLTAEDAVAYQRIRLMGLRECPTAFSASLSDEEGWTLEQFAGRLNPTPDGPVWTFGAFLDGHLAGVLSLVRASREKLRHGAELCAMYVDPECRRRGVGGALLDAVIAHARSLTGLRQLKLGVNATNGAARALYESRGFALIGLEPQALCIDGQFYDEAFYLLRLTALESSYGH